MSADLLRIFVSSPGDVGEERVMTERVVQRLQGWFGQSVRLEPIIWEHEPLRATSHPNLQIPLPADCDIVVCLLWSRLGTRLPPTVSAEGKTGTEWEFEQAAHAFRERHVPDLLVYRKTKEVLASVHDETTYQEKKDQWYALNRFLTHWFKSEDGTFKAVFKTFEALDQFEDMLERDLRKLIQERLKLAPRGEKTWHQAPFRGLEVFHYEHAPIFFGRTRAIGAIREALVQQAARGCAFVLVFGMSGVGKSSLVRAGLLPTITQPGVIEGVGLWRWCVFRPSDTIGDLCDGLASALMTSQALPELTEAGVDAGALAKLLREAPDQAALPISVGLKRAAETTVAAEHLSKSPVSRLALVVDQMEELFSLERVNEKERISFVKALSALARSGLVWIIGTMRSDFYRHCADLPELAALKSGAGQFDLLPPSAPEVAQMIEYPARAAGLRFEEKGTGEKLEHVLQEKALGDPQALPLLEFTLDELYKLCSRDTVATESVVLTFAAYEQLGEMEGAVARRAEEEFAHLPPAVQATLSAVFRKLVTVRAGVEQVVVTQPAPRQVFEGTAEQNTLVEAFIKARLLVIDGTGTGEAVVRLAHEALLRRWPRLEKTLADDRDFLRIRALTAEASGRWNKEGKLPELLLPRGKPLADAESLLTRREELQPELLKYIELSRQSATRARRRLALALATAFLLLVVGTTLSTVLAIRESNANGLAETRRRDAVNALADKEKAYEELKAKQDELEGETARSWLMPLAMNQKEMLLDQEIDVFGAVAGKREEHVTLRFIQEGASESRFRRRLGARAPYIIHAAVGLDAKKRAEVERILVERLRQKELSLEDKMDLSLSVAALGDIKPQIAAEAAATLAQAMSKTTDGNALLALAKVLSAVALRMGPKEAAAVLTQAMIWTRDRDALGALVEGLSAVAPRMEPQEAGQAAAALTQAMTKITDHRTLEVLAWGLSEVAPRMELKKACEAAAALTQAMTKTTDVDALVGLTWGLLAVAKRMEPKKVGEPVAALAQAMTKTKDREALGALAWSLGKVAPLMEPKEASEAVATLTQALNKTTDRDALRALAQGLVAVAARMEPKEASRVCTEAADTLTKAMSKTTDGVALRALAQGLAAVAARMEPKEASRVCTEAADTLMQVMTKTTDRDASRALAEGLAAVAARMEPKEATAWLLAQAMNETTDRVASRALAQGLAAVAARMEPKEATATLTNVRNFTRNNDDALFALAQGLAAVAARMEPKEAAKASATLIETMHFTIHDDALHALAKGLAAVAARMEPKEAAAALTQAMTKTTSPDASRALAEGLAAVAARMEPKEASRVCTEAADTLTKAMSKTTDGVASRGLAKGLAAVAARMEPKEATATLTKVMTKTTDRDAFLALADGLAAVAARIESKEASRVCAEAADTLMQIMTTTDPETSYALARGLARALAAVAARMEPKEATATLTKVMTKTTDRDALRALAEGLAAVAARMEPKEASRVCTEAADTLTKAMSKTTDGVALRALAQGLAAVAARMEPKEASRVCTEAADTLTKAMSKTTDGIALRALAQGLAAVAARMEPKEATATLTKVRNFTRNNDDALFALAEGLWAVLHRESFERCQQRVQSATTLAGLGTSPAILAVPTVLPHPRLELPEPLPTEMLVEILKYPLCVGEARRLVLDALATRYHRTFVDQWEFVRFAHEQNLGLDLAGPPKTRQSTELKLP